MKLISIIAAMLLGIFASATASAGGYHGGGGWHGGGWHGTGWHGGFHSGGPHVHFGIGIGVGPPFWPWYYPGPYYYPPPVYYSPPVYYAPPPAVYYNNSPVVVTPSAPSYATPPLAAPGTPGNPVVELPPNGNAPMPSAAQQAQQPNAMAQAAPTQLFMYPRQNQDAQLQARDRDECYRWALDQLGYDQSKSPAGLSAGQSADYYRAMTACLDGRGYSVR